MTKEQVVQLREYHQGHNMMITRTEGFVYHENNGSDFAYLIFDDNEEIMHAINTNNNMQNMKERIQIDSCDYADITGIMSKRNYNELKQYLDSIKNAGILNGQLYKEILEKYEVFK